VAFFYWPARLVARGKTTTEKANMADELDSAIKTNAEGPKSAGADGVTVQQHSLADQIAADKYLESKRAGRNPSKALTRVKIVPPGTA